MHSKESAGKLRALCKHLLVLVHLSVHLFCKSFHRAPASKEVELAVEGWGQSSSPDKPSSWGGGDLREGNTPSGVGEGSPGEDPGTPGPGEDQSALSSWGKISGTTMELLSKGGLKNATCVRHCGPEG